MKSNKPVITSALSGKKIALPESRQLDILADLFERRGANVLRIPLVAILDAPNQGPVRSWLQNFSANPPDYFIVLTGEGLRRLRAAAERGQNERAFIEALRKTCKICRGPKPGRALKQMGLEPDLLGIQPTTAGIIAKLETLPLQGKRISVQLYGEDPNMLLMQYLKGKNLANYDTVAPYVYANDSDTEQVKSLIQALSEGGVDLLAFTSQPQVLRLIDVAKQNNLMSELNTGFTKTRIAAIGPVVSALLESLGCRVDIIPTDSYFMKPLVTASEKLFKHQARLSVPVN